MEPPPNDSWTGRGKGRELRPRILILEDGLGDGVFMRQLQKVNLAGFVKIVTDGKDALDFLNNEAAQGGKLIAMFLDLKLSMMGGLHVLEKIRAEKNLRHLPVIVMTSSSVPAEMEKCRKLGVSCYVQKPITLASFTKAVADSFHVPLSEL
jgi:CheY-like chemotaxis protein